MKELIGAVIHKMFVNEDQSMLKFETDKGVFAYYADGDCCSETWFADILFDSGFFNKEVIKVEEIQVPEFVTKMANSDGRTRQEFDEVYGYQVTVNKQKGWYGDVTCDIIFRNSSNGYYGGTCELMDLNQKWYKERYDEAEWTQISEDWKA